MLTAESADCGGARRPLTELKITLSDDTDGRLFGNRQLRRRGEWPIRRLRFYMPMTRERGKERERGCTPSVLSFTFSQTKNAKIRLVFQQIYSTFNCEQRVAHFII